MNVEIVTFDPRHAAAFAALNYEWIERFFEVEDEDRKALDHPEAYAIEPGGEIFFVLEDGEAVGTVAMVPHGEGFELAKMAVRPDRQGRGYSKLLMDACLAFARERGATEVMLVTNDVLAPALGLYKQAGFRPVERYTDDRYARGNLQMLLTLSSLSEKA